MGWKDERQDFKKNYSWEDYYDNPYADLIDTAASAAQYDAARKSYIAWEAEQQQYQQQLSDSIAMRDSERAYNSPTEQIRRLRSAGVNPDVSASSGSTGGSVGSGTSAAPSVPSLSPSQFVPASSDEPTSAEWMQTAGAFINQVGTFATQVVGLVEQVGSMSSALSMRRSQAESASLQTHRDRMLSVGELAQGLPVGEDLTEEQIDTYLDDLLVDDKSLRNGLKHYVKTPSYQAAVNEAMMRQRQSQSWLESMPLESLNDFNEAQRRADLAQSQSDALQSEFYKVVAEVEYQNVNQFSDDDLLTFSVTEGVDTMGAARVAMNNREQREHDISRQERARSVYRQHLTNLRSTVNTIKSQIKYIQSLPPTVDRNALIAAKKVELMQVMAIGNDSLHSLYDYAMRSYKRHYDAFAAAGDNLNVEMFEQSFSKHKFIYSDRVFMSGIVEDEDAIDKVLDVVDSLFNLAKSSSPAGGVLNAVKGLIHP